jgi:CRP/FNR family transcriptional regulator, cyclic AMP receptor protein
MFNINNDSYLDAGTQYPTETVVDLIARSGFFYGFAPNEINLLAEWVKAYSVPAGAFILREREGDNCLCILVEGSVNIYKKSEPDKHVKIATVRPHESIGEMGVVDGKPFSASVIASTDSTILIITKDEFDTLIIGNEKLGVKLLRNIASIISSRLRKTTGRLADLLSNE